MCVTLSQRAVTTANILNVMRVASSICSTCRKNIWYTDYAIVFVSVYTYCPFLHVYLFNNQLEKSTILFWFHKKMWRYNVLFKGHVWMKYFYVHDSPILIKTFRNNMHSKAIHTLRKNLYGTNKGHKLAARSLKYMVWLYGKRILIE